MTRVHRVRAAAVKRERDDPEKREETGGRVLMETVLGFTCWHLSQSRATNQTPGWPDMKFTHRARRIALWWEAKAPDGKQTAAQREFQLDVEACGEVYVLGPYQALEDWAVAQGLVERLPSGFLKRRGMA